MDRHKAELTSILFPIFVHCYFGLIKYCDVDNSNQADLPHIFLTRWGHEFQIHYPNEIIALQSITMIEHLESHDYAKLLLAVDPVSAPPPSFYFFILLLKRSKTKNEEAYIATLC